MKKIISIFLITAIVMFAFSACDANSFRNSVNGVTDAETTKPTTTEPTTAYTTVKRDKTKQHVKMVVKDYGTVVFEMDEKDAPISVAQFVSLVKKGFYDGLKFHRITNNSLYVVQGGASTEECPTIKGEFSANGVNNTLSHKRGVIAMARATGNDTASSQFYVCYEDSTCLDGQYATFGYVISGMDVIDKLSKVPVSNEIISDADQPTIEKMVMDD